MVINFLVCAGAVSFGYLMESENCDFDQCLVMDEQRLPQFCTGPTSHFGPSNGMPPLPDIILSNTPPASPIRRTTSCPYFFFQEEPKTQDIQNPQSVPATPFSSSTLPLQNQDMLTPPSSPAATSDDERVFFRICRCRGTGKTRPGVQSDRATITSYDLTEDGEEVTESRMSSNMLVDSHHYKYHHHHHPYHHHRCHRTTSRQHFHRNQHHRDLPYLQWGVPLHQCLRQVGHCCRHQRNFALITTREERLRWRLVGHDLRRLADHFQALHSKVDGKDEDWLSISLSIPVVLTRCLSASILCIIRWKLFNRLQ